MKYSIILILLFTSCISINNINYKYLTKIDKQSLVPFNKEYFNKNIDNKIIQIQEISSGELIDVLSELNYSCVYLWKPYCKSDVCKTLNYYSTLEKQFENSNFRIIIISLTYDVKDIEKAIRLSGYDKQVYVIKYNKKYGNNIWNVYRGFVNEITNNNLSKNYYSYYLFKTDHFIKDVKDINSVEIESILNIK